MPSFVSTQPLVSTNGPPSAVRRGIVAALAFVVLAACGGGDSTEPTATAQPATFENLDPATLAAMLNEKDFPLINVHIPYEGEIEPTDAFIPFDEIEAKLDMLPSDRDARIVLYCRSGSMSATAAQTLVDLGYTNVAHLEGGMIAWEEAGYPLVMREGIVAADRR